MPAPTRHAAAVTPMDVGAERETVIDNRNEVRLVGRLPALPELREFPSGDKALVFRLVVAREKPREGGPTVDTIDCVALRADVRRSLGRWGEGDVVRVEGSLRRRFWRGPVGPVSRYEVEVSGASRLRRAERGS